MIQLYVYILFHILFHYDFSQGIEYSSLCCWTLLFTHPIHNGLHLLIPDSQSIPLTLATTSPFSTYLDHFKISHLLLGRKVMTNLDSILQSRDTTLPTKVRLVKAMVFPVVIYGCESWTVKKAERWRIDAFELWCWRRLLRVPSTARISNQSILKEISPGCSLERLMLKLKLQYFGHLIRRVNSLAKTLMLGGIGGRRRMGRQRMRWLDGITDSMGMS